MTIAFVIGNGVSRQGIPLDNLKQYGKIYGCNALYRDFIPDVLVATDRPISTRIQDEGYAIKNVFYTRRPIENLGALRLPQQYYGYSSGPNALGLACIDGARRIYLIGFDMGPGTHSGFNNVYADTEFYKTATSLPTFTGNWVKQVCKITQDFSNNVYTRVCGITTKRIQELDALSNLRHEDLDVFLNRINNTKDF